LTNSCRPFFLQHAVDDGLPEALIDGDPLRYERVEQFAARARSIDDLLRNVRALPGVRIEDDATAVLISRSPTGA
jgi:hypothetical protein